MLDRECRAAVLLLRQQGHSLRAIAAALGISRDSVVAVLAAGTADVPAVEPEGLTFFGGAAKRCVIDNTSVIIAHGTGKDAVAAAELEALADRFGFRFLAHELGDRNRSAKVERPFHFVENNLYPGRRFADVDDCNRQLRAWCDRQNGTFRRRLHARPLELLVSERPSLSPLPIFVPEIYEPHSRMVDLTGCVTLHTNRYSAPPELIDRRVEVRECKACVRIFVGPRQVAEHPPLEPGRDKGHRLPEHRIRGDASLKEMRARPIAEENRLRAADPLLASYVDGLRRHRPGRAVVAPRRLERLWTEYPAAAVLGAVADAQRYGLYDLGRLERMILRRLAGEYFNSPPSPKPGSDSSQDD